VPLQQQRRGFFKVVKNLYVMKKFPLMIKFSTSLFKPFQEKNNEK
jgi:hypothetical protein